MIPFLDLKSQHLELEEELISVFRDALRNAAFVGGPQVEAFEEEFAGFCETKYCIGVSSGTDALRFALIAAGIGPGDEVITVPNTFIATVEAISQTGAVPVFVDVDERTYNMHSEKLTDFLENQCNFDQSTNQLIDQSTKCPVRAVIPVHLYGQPADMDIILEIANHYDLIVIEDACQAHGAEYYSEKENKWKKAGSLGLAAAFSFYPGKNLGACGEAGAVTTSDEEVAQKVRMLRDHGQAKKYLHEIEGYNGRLDTIQAGVLRIKLKNLVKWNEARRKNAQVYRSLLDGCQGVIPPFEPRNVRAVYHLYVILATNRDGLLRYLGGEGINTGLHYPIPIHLQSAFQSSRPANKTYPVTEKIAKEILSLPMHPNLTEDHIRTVVTAIKQFYSRDPALGTSGW
jgi:dTDP-4-amino-4,6-dideoxygalactose transaminase